MSTIKKYYNQACTILFIVLGMSVFASDSAQMSSELEGLIMTHQVEYDVAASQQEYGDMAQSYISIATIYFNHGQLDAAESFAWRSKIICEQYDVLEKELLACKLLQRINEKQGDLKESASFDMEYQEILARLIKADKPTPVNVPIVSQANTSTSISPTFILLAIMSIVFIGFFVWLMKGHAISIVPKFANGNEMQIQNQAVKTSPVEKEPSEFVKRNESDGSSDLVNEQEEDIEIRLDSVNLSDMDHHDESEDEHLDRFVAADSAISSSPVPIANDSSENTQTEAVPAETLVAESQEEVLSVTEQIAQFRYQQKVTDPIWMQELKSRFSKLDSFRGVQVNFHTVGDFDGFSTAMSDSLLTLQQAISDEVFESKNLLRLNASLVRNNWGLIFLFIAIPIDADQPVISEFQLRGIRKSDVIASNNNEVEFLTHHNGTFKVVVKLPLQS